MKYSLFDAMWFLSPRRFLLMKSGKYLGFPGWRPFDEVPESCISVDEDFLDIQDATASEARIESEGTIPWDRIKQEFDLLEGDNNA